MLVLGAQIHFLEEGKTSQTGQNRRVFYFFESPGMMVSGCLRGLNLNPQI